MKQHTRVIPRDFFNEAKLLKCLGRFELLVNHEGTGLKLPIKTEHDGGPFDIVQDPLTGNLSVTNYIVSLNGHIIQLYTCYNSKDNYPLIGLYKGEEYFIFDENGKWLPNFGVNV